MKGAHKTMFKKRLTFKIDKSEVVNFCRLLGKYGLKFKISNLLYKATDIDADNRHYYREMVVDATKKRAYKRYEAINVVNGRYLMR